MGVVIEPAPAVKLDSGVDRPFLEQIRAVADERCLGADVHLVCLDRGVPDDLPVEEARDDDRDVPLVRAGEVRVVDDEHVTWLEAAAVGVVLRDRLDAQAQAAGEQRQALDLRKHAELAVVERPRPVEHVVDDRGEGGAPQGHEHLIRGGVKAVADNRGGDRVDSRMGLGGSHLVLSLLRARVRRCAAPVRACPRNSSISASPCEAPMSSVPNEYW